VKVIEEFVNRQFTIENVLFVVFTKAIANLLGASLTSTF